MCSLPEERLSCSPAFAHVGTDFAGPLYVKESLNIKEAYECIFVGGAVAPWLVRSTPDRVVRVRGLAGDIALCSWARHFTLTVPLSTQVYNWVPA